MRFSASCRALSCASFSALACAWRCFSCAMRGSGVGLCVGAGLGWVLGFSVGFAVGLAVGTGVGGCFLFGFFCPKWMSAASSGSAGAGRWAFGLGGLGGLAMGSGTLAAWAMSAAVHKPTCAGAVSSSILMLWLRQPQKASKPKARCSAKASARLGHLLPRLAAGEKGVAAESRGMGLWPNTTPAARRLKL